MKTKKIATNLPQELLKEATNISGLNQTQTLIEALKELIKSYKRRKLLQLKGKLKITYNLNKGRQRRKV